MQSDSPIRVQCFECGDKGAGHLVAKCKGNRLGGNTPCNSLSSNGDNVYLLQVVPAPEGQTCDIMFVEPEYRSLLLFDPCGHYVSVGTFAMGVRVKSEGDEGRGRITESPLTPVFIRVSTRLQWVVHPRHPSLQGLRTCGLQLHEAVGCR